MFIKRLLTCTMAAVLAVVLLPAAGLAAPTPPGSLAATIQAGPPLGVALTWTDSTGEIGYRVMRAVAPAAPSTDITAATNGLAADSVSFTDATVTAGVTYSYQVVASDALAATATSNTVIVTASVPAAPTVLAAQNVAGPPQAVGLTWTDNSTSEIGFRIDRAGDVAFTQNLVQRVVAVNVAALTDADIVPGTAYSYRVVALATAGASAPSNVATIATTAAAGMAVGAVAPIAGFGAASGYPLYYQDTLGTKLNLLPVGPVNFTDPVIIGNAYSAALGFGTEAFYYLAGPEGLDTGTGTLVLVEFAIEAVFGSPAGDAVPGTEAVMARTRMRFDVPVSGDYTVQTPYGTRTFTGVVAGVPGFDVNFTEDIGAIPRIFSGANSPIQPQDPVLNPNPVNVFLRPVAPQLGVGIFGDGITPTAVTGGPNGNSVTITGPTVNTTSSTWLINGRLLSAPVVPSFTKSVAPATGLAPAAATFTDTTAGTPTSWLWDFGDGVTSTLQNPAHTYTSAGNFIVTLTASNIGGSATASQMVSTFNAPGATFTNAIGATPLTMNFTSSLVGNPTGWAWDFGDGQTSNLQNPTHVYAAPGTFTITLQVFNGGGTATSSEVLIVGPPATPTNLTAVLTLAGVPPALQGILNWTDTSTSETGFRLEHADDAAFTLGLHSHSIAANVTTFTDTVTPNTTTFWRVFAVSGNGDSAASNTAQLNAAGPTAPTVTATPASSTQINLSWADVASETTYRVERAADAAFTAPVVLSPALAANTTGFIDATVTASGTFFYRVVAVNIVGEAASAVVPATTPAPPTQVPADPRNLGAALVSPGRVDLTWQDRSNNEAGFRIERAGDAAFTPPVTSITVTANVTGASDTSITSAGTFFYRVYAFNVVGDSGNPTNTVSLSVVPTVVPTAPSTVTAVAASPAPGVLQVNLTWANDAVNQATFRIERSTDGITFTPVSTVASNVAAFTDTSVTAGGTFTYRVIAVNAVGDSTTAATSAPVALTVPVAPVMATPTIVSTTQVDLAWTSAATGLTGFRIERSTNGGAFEPLGTALATTTTYSDTSVIANTAYTYRVIATNIVGDSLASNQRTASLALPAAPAPVTATAGVNAITVTWTNVATDATGIRIERSNNGVDFAPSGTVGPTATTYSDTGLAAGAQFFYRVIAVNAVGDSAVSAIVSATALAPPQQQQQPQPQATPVPVPTATPIPPPTIITEDKVVPITKKEGESTAIVQPDKQGKVELEDRTVITVPPLAMPVTVQMKGRNVAEKDLPKPITRGKVKKALEIEVFDDKGSKIESVEIRVPIMIEVPLSADDLAAIGDDPNNVEVHRYDDGLGVWVKLASELDLANKVVRAQLRHLSLFAVVVPAPVGQAQPTPTAAPPSAGGTVPGSSAWLLAIVVGLGILLFGFRMLRVSRKPVRKD